MLFRSIRAHSLPAHDHPLADLRGKPILYSGTNWPIALQEFVRAGGGPFDTPLGGDNRARLSAEFQESTMPVLILILPQKFTDSLPVFLRDGSFHMVSILRKKKGDRHRR